MTIFDAGAEPHGDPSEENLIIGYDGCPVNSNHPSALGTSTDEIALGLARIAVREFCEALGIRVPAEKKLAQASNVLVRLIASLRDDRG